MTVIKQFLFINFRSRANPVNEKIKNYNFFHLLSIYMNASNATAKFPLVLGILFMLLCFGVYGGVTLYGKVGIFTYVVFPMLCSNCFVLTSLILLPASKQHKLSTIHLHNINQFHVQGMLVPSKAMKRSLKCLNRFGISSGISIVKYTYVAQFILALSNTCLSLLVAFPNAR